MSKSDVYSSERQLNKKDNEYKKLSFCLLSYRWTQMTNILPHLGLFFAFCYQLLTSLYYSSPIMFLILVIKNYKLLHGNEYYLFIHDEDFLILIII